MNTPRTTTPALVPAAMIASALLLAGCATETKIVRYHTILSGLPGVESQMPVGTASPSGYADPTVLPIEKLVEEDKDGKKTLVARSARHLMIHIHNTLEEGDKELFVDQVLSQATKRECQERNVDPGDAFDYFASRRDDIRALFNLMPAGERTAGVRVKTLSRDVWRVQLPSPPPEDLHWIGFDMVMEKGSWRLRWFIEQ